MKTPRISAATTSGTSASRRCGTWNACASRRLRECPPMLSFRHRRIYVLKRVKGSDPASADLPSGMNRPLRVGSVSFVNAKPLIYGLESARDVELSLAVPSKLLDGLREERLDVALLPVID